MRYKHDCESCVELSECGKYDLYYCEQSVIGVPTLIARYGDVGHEYSTYNVALIGVPIDEPFVTAYRAAVARGLTKEDAPAKKEDRASESIVHDVESLLLDACRPFIRSELANETATSLCAVVSGWLHELKTHGDIPLGMDVSCGLLRSNLERIRVVVWLSDELQRWLWGEIRVEPNRDFIVLRQRDALRT